MHSPHLRRYGWRRDLPDIRDHYLRGLPALHVPPAVDLTPGCGPVLDQGDLGACTAHALAGALMFDMQAQKRLASVPSRLFIYYNERALEHAVEIDGGASLRDGIKALNRWGFCPEPDWPYNTALFAIRPPDKAFSDATPERITAYQRIPQGLQAMQSVLASGKPFVLGFMAYSALESDAVAASGVMPMPDPNDTPLGGHAVLCIGYDMTQRTFLCRNSWGPGWGQEGNFTMPFDYTINPDLAADFWAITAIP